MAAETDEVTRTVAAMSAGAGLTEAAAGFVLGAASGLSAKATRPQVDVEHLVAGLRTA